MEKIKYEFDPHNRLTIKDSALRGVRRVLDGQFKIDDHNILTYHIKAPVPSDIKTPHQVKLKGVWSLTKGHQLCLTLDKWQRQTFGDQLTLQGEILDVRKNSLLFALTTKTKDGLPSVYVLEFAGAWQADEHNRLTFRIEKENSKSDSLIFDGGWRINENYEIVYRYQKEKLVRKVKKIHNLIFKGHWDIRDKARLSYVLDSKTDSGFNFNTAIGIFKDGYIKYELGIGLSRLERQVKRVITFFGKWKIKKNAGLVFELERQAGKIQALVFGAQAKLTDKDSVSFNLRNSLDEAMGAQLELSRDIFSGDGQVFLRLLESKQEAVILTGAGWRW